MGASEDREKTSLMNCTVTLKITKNLLQKVLNLQFF